MLNFVGAVWAAAVRTVPCPYCRRTQTVVRRPVQFAVTCHDCRGSFRVNPHGTVFPGADKSQPSRSPR